MVRISQFGPLLTEMVKQLKFAKCSLQREGISVILDGDFISVEAELLPDDAGAIVETAQKNNSGEQKTIQLSPATYQTQTQKAHERQSVASGYSSASEQTQVSPERTTTQRKDASTVKSTSMETGDGPTSEDTTKSETKHVTINNGGDNIDTEYSIESS